MTTNTDETQEVVVDDNVVDAGDSADAGDVVDTDGTDYGADDVGDGDDGEGESEGEGEGEEED